MQERIHKLRGIADGCRGSATEITVSRQDVAVLNQSAKKKVNCEGASVKIPAKQFCSMADAAFKSLHEVAETPAEQPQE